ncbi:MAG: SRPBCC family protein [Solirubrobacterales bacterium]|nr:SRPBCC family protein [Solirubrobacterales bacterium]
MKQLTGSATGTTAATPEQAFALLEAIDGYPSWYPEVIKEAEVLERDAQGRPTRARTKLHVERGPLTRDFNLRMSVTEDPIIMIKLSRIPNEPSDDERFDVTWRVEAGQPTRIRLDLLADLSVPRMVPLGGVGNALAQGMVSAATRALASS